MVCQWFFKVDTKTLVFSPSWKLDALFYYAVHINAHLMAGLENIEALAKYSGCSSVMGEGVFSQKMTFRIKNMIDKSLYF